jgi:Holliday junction resolvase RusA-like endonuclease
MQFQTEQQVDALLQAMQNPKPKILFQTEQQVDALLKAMQNPQILFQTNKQADASIQTMQDPKPKILLSTEEHTETIQNKMTVNNGVDTKEIESSDDSKKKKKVTKITKTNSKQKSSLVNEINIKINVEVDTKSKKNPNNKPFNKNELDNLKIQGLKDLCKHFDLATTKCKVRNDYINLLIPHATQ